MIDKNNNTTPPAQPTSDVQALLSNRTLTWTIVVIAALILIVLTTITILAFAQGRRVSVFGLEIEAQPTSLPDAALTETTPEADQEMDVGVVPIENFSGEVFSFSGGGGLGQLKVIRSEDNDLDYIFDYDMLQGGDGYAGLFFRFTPTIDLTAYTALQTTVSFSDDDAICELYLEDPVGGKSTITLGNKLFTNASQDAKMEMVGTDRVFTVPLENNFLDISSKQSIEGIGFGINATQVEGAHSCTVQEIILVK